MNSPKGGPTTDQGKAVASRNATQITLGGPYQDEPMKVVTVGDGAIGKATRSHKYRAPLTRAHRRRTC